VSRSTPNRKAREKRRKTHHQATERTVPRSTPNRKAREKKKKQSTNSLTALDSPIASPSAKKKKQVRKGPTIDLFIADPPGLPTADAKKYGDVTNTALQKKCKRIYKLLNYDPWNEATRYDDDDMCDYVIENPEPCNVKFEFDGFSGCIYPFSMCYALKASLDTVESVYDAFPAAIKETDWWIGTPFHYAGAYKAPAEIVEFLIRRDPKGIEATNYYGRTALHMGALYQAPTRSMLILCKKYPMAARIKDKDGRIPLHLACENDAPAEVIRQLVQSYPLSVYTTGEYEMTPLHLACSKKARPDVVRAILEGADAGEESVCKATDLLGHTPLHIALIGLATYEAMELLIGACPETVWIKTNNGELPLDLAKRKRAPQNVLEILERTMERVLLENSES